MMSEEIENAQKAYVKMIVDTVFAEESKFSDEFVALAVALNLLLDEILQRVIRSSNDRA